jgi:predicted glycogen debranching enzyme
MPNLNEFNLARRIDLSAAQPDGILPLLNRQWLITNGLGGYASGTIAGTVTWRYHGLLIAALPAPLGRTLMLNHLVENLRLPDQSMVQFGGAEPTSANDSAGPNYLVEFRLENQIPIWRYDIKGVSLEKRLVMPYLQNTVHLTYTLLSKNEGCSLDLRPSLHFRPLEGAVSMPREDHYELRLYGGNFEIESHRGHPPLRLCIDAPDAVFLYDGGGIRNLFYELEAERGYDSRGTLWSPGHFSIPLSERTPVTLMASTETWRTINALDAATAYSIEADRRRRLLRIADSRAQKEPAAELVLAADQFIISPPGRITEAARAKAAGDELRSVIAGYHWFTDWGRDTMISLEGLTIVTGRYQEAEWILKTFAHYVTDGLIPNMFPEGKNEGVYHTADATLWFFHALSRYVDATNDQETLKGLLPILVNIMEHHERGTQFGIGVDSRDGLLHQGAPGYQLTWMDAKVGDWVVTPRRGKAVEINALWYNALRLLQHWLDQAGEEATAKSLAEQADRAQISFNHRFWNERLNCLYDVVDGEQGDDPSIRPNQLIAFSLTYPVLDERYWHSVLKVVEEQLVTPVGLRSLNRDDKEYKAKYFGDIRARDAAYHQGTVWAWLIGPFIDAWLKVHPGNRPGARKFLEGFIPRLSAGCIGSIAEIFDAESPFKERGCIAQAWSVAEILRCLVRTEEEPPARF